jgi:hypothetical protein
VKANPKKWFPAIYTAKIWLRKVDRWAESRKKEDPYFDTWEEAHAYSVDRAKIRRDRAAREAESAQRHLARVLALKQPDAP